MFENTSIASSFLHRLPASTECAIYHTFLGTFQLKRINILATFYFGILCFENSMSVCTLARNRRATELFERFHSVKTAIALGL